MQRRLTIAIDGPAGTGKIARILAKKLGYVHVDTGAMYRAVTLKALRTKVPFTDPNQLIALAKDCSIDLLPSVDSKTVVTLDGEDCSLEIREPQIDKNVSAVACIGEIRSLMVQKQQNLAKKGGIIMDGRDIGTVVLPDAEVKIFMRASPEIRAVRRLAELQEKGNNTMTLEEILSELIRRDSADESSNFDREHGPLKKADDAIEIDSTEAPVEDIVEKIYALILKKANEQV